MSSRNAFRLRLDEVEGRLAPSAGYRHGPGPDDGRAGDFAAFRFDDHGGPGRGESRGDGDDSPRGPGGRDGGFRFPPPVIPPPRDLPPEIREAVRREITDAGGDFGALRAESRAAALRRAPAELPPPVAAALPPSRPTAGAVPPRVALTADAPATPPSAPAPSAGVAAGRAAPGEAPLTQADPPPAPVAAVGGSAPTAPEPEGVDDGLDDSAAPVVADAPAAPEAPADDFASLVWNAVEVVLPSAPAVAGALPFDAAAARDAAGALAGRLAEWGADAAEVAAPERWVWVGGALLAAGGAAYAARPRAARRPDDAAALAADSALARWEGRGGR